MRTVILFPVIFSLGVEKIAHFHCTKCGFETKVPDANKGKKGKCPKCGHIEIIEAAKPEERKLEKPDIYSYDSPPPAEEAASEPQDNTDTDEEQEEDRDLPAGMKECPICGEHIRLKARKCRYCGEIIDRGLAKAKKKEKHRDLMRRRRTYGPSEVSSAKTAFICGLLGLFCFGVILGPMAIFLGISAHNEIKRRKGEATGAGMATAGIVLGGIDIIAWIIFISMYAAN